MSISSLKRNIFFKYIVFGIIFFFWGASAQANINLQGQTPQAQFSSTDHDFGTIYQGQTLTHSFHFQNTGNGILVLTSLHASCGCVNARSLAENGITSKNIFRPGEKGMISVDFDSSQFSGPIKRTITVETNADEKKSSATLNLTANIIQEISTSPALLYLGKITKFSENSYFIRMNIKTKDINILGIESDLPFLETALVPDKNNPQSIQLVIKLKPEKSLPLGPFHGNLIVKNNSKHYPKLNIPVMGEAIGHIDTSTQFVEFGVVKSAQPSNRSITFKSTNTDFKIKNIKIDLNQFAYAKQLNEKDLFEVAKVNRTYKTSTKPINEYQLDITLKYPNRLSSGTKKALLTGVNVSGKFVIETNDPDYTEVQIPFFGILKYE